MNTKRACPSTQEAIRFQYLDKRSKEIFKICVAEFLLVILSNIAFFIKNASSLTID